jgi:hypothetical protein
MTREEQRTVREANKAMNKAIHPECKKHGYKVINGFIYKTIDEYVYTLIVLACPVDFGKLITATLNCKPIKLDEIFWDVFDMSETAKGQPFSFHVQGAFTAQSLRLNEWKSPLTSANMIEQTMDAILEQTDQFITSYSQKLKTIQDFKIMIAGQQHHKLNSILCEIAEENYSTALEQIENELSNNQTGGFICGSKSIMEYAKEYCQHRV